MVFMTAKGVSVRLFSVVVVGPEVDVDVDVVEVEGMDVVGMVD